MMRERGGSPHRDKQMMYKAVGACMSPTHPPRTLVGHHEVGHDMDRYDRAAEC